jgi:hypothetical protein
MIVHAGPGTADRLRRVRRIVVVTLAVAGCHSTSLRAGVVAPSAKPPSSLTTPASQPEDLALRARRQRDELVQTMERSGAPSAGWPVRVARMFGAWKLQRVGRGDPLVREPMCFSAGCYVDVVSRDPATLGRFSEWLSARQDFLAWPGPRVRTADIRLDNDRFLVTWAVFRPTESPR